MWIKRKPTYPDIETWENPRLDTLVGICPIHGGFRLFIERDYRITLGICKKKSIAKKKLTNYIKSNGGKHAQSRILEEPNQ